MKRGGVRSGCRLAEGSELAFNVLKCESRESWHCVMLLVQLIETYMVLARTAFFKPPAE